VDEGDRTGCPLRSFTETTGRPGRRHRRTEPTLLGSACPSEVSPSRVAGYGLPASPRSSAPKRSGPRGVPRSDYPALRRAPDPPLGFGSPTGFPTDRSGRPVAGSAPPVRFFAPTTTTRSQVRFTRVCLTRHLPASRFRPPRRFTPCDRCRSEDRRRPWGSPFRALPLRSAAPVTGPLPSCRFRLSLPSPLRTRRSGAPPRLQSIPPIGGPYPSGGSWPPSGPMPSWVASPSEALAPPRWNRLPGSSPHVLRDQRTPKRPRPLHSRVSLGGEVRRTLSSPPAPLGSVASAYPTSRPSEEGSCE
jgi:hypothetical protein